MSTFNITTRRFDYAENEAMGTRLVQIAVSCQCHSRIIRGSATDNLSEPE